MTLEFSLLVSLIFLSALLYSSVGHGGASAYLASMALIGIAPETMRPAALVLNVAVASIALYKFYRVGAFSAKLFWPLAIAAMPMAFLGGMISLPSHIYKPIIGIVLIYAAWLVLRRSNQAYQVNLDLPKTPVLLVFGALLGLLSGLTGVGGGIFLSPLLLFFRWAEMRVISGVSAAFILVNSLSGLAGVMTKAPELPATLPYWVLAAVIGGFIGAEYGSKRLAVPAIRKALVVVLLIAGLKMLLT
ncbi:MAG: sulfite exporter TauE/SafE family protein [Methylotenera sp.]|nr:sulfite exporter TauE/SafE family protein [Methylotenera sp.]MDO9233639.1 sulfite exporter TauE/SafE family protein [Methylotenera sp.]MDO9389663.1 sulfite exporter TauE/SafE family protein [Methylotenera sp.]MDP1595843.1 sulfite exporter TauE/SafE family protein [Methylotenera sp.]MDP1754301.1 sulfite exporter TauE/SafE family protein [Methylotenera sp.]